MGTKDDEILTLQEVAQLLKVKPSWIYSRTCRGQSVIPCFRLGRHLRFSKEKVFKALGISI